MDCRQSKLLYFWENNGVGGNYVKVDLHGTYSNTDAIGSVVEYWIDGNKKRYGTFIGEGFLSQNAHTKIIGIDEANAIDSLSIHWPMGLVETYYNLQAGERYDYIKAALYRRQLKLKTMLYSALL
ncbi:MAG: ASPIC/UnbV domain-containing protein [Flavobacteriales bacterium]